MGYKLVPEESTPKESGVSKALRYPAQIAKEGAATVLGFPGDVGNLINTFVAGPITKKITGKESVPYEETPIGKVLHTSAEHREFLEEKIPYLKPKNKSEQFVADLAADTAALLIPTKTKIPFKNTLVKAFSTSLGANVLGKSVKDITGDEKKGSYAKMGALFGLSLLNKSAASKYASDLYSKAEKALPKSANVNAASLQKSLDSLKSRILKGRSPRDLAPSEKFVVEEANKILRSIKGGKIDLETAVASKRSLNEQMQGLYQTLGEKSGRNRAKVLASEINGALRKTMKDYGKQNPEWYKLASSADEAFGTLAKSNFISNSLKNHVTYSPVTHGLLHLLAGSTGVAGGIVPYEIGKLSYRIAKSPILRRYYINVLKSASQENVVSLNKEVARLDHALQKEKPKEIWKPID